MPLGMEDVSKLLRITDALLKKGYSELDIQKILGLNILRVKEEGSPNTWVYRLDKKRLQKALGTKK